MTDLKDYARFDTRLLSRSLGPHTSTNYMVQADNGWLGMKKRAAELEAHRERVRQIYSSAFSAAKTSSEWVQGLVYLEGAKTLEELKKFCDSFDIQWKDEGDMVTKDDQINALKSQIAELNAKLDKVQYGRMGKEPANGTVLKIEKRYSSTGPKYIYAAIKADGQWYLTGTTGAGVKVYTWEALKSYIGEHSRVWLMAPSKEYVD